MSTTISMPSYSATMESAKLLAWRVQEGESVVRGQVIADIETDKAVTDLETPAAGTVISLLVPAGQADVPVNTPLAILVAEGESAIGVPLARDSAAARVVAASADAPQESAARGSPAAHVRASPAARHAARLAGIDLSTIRGTGPHGRIVKEDLDMRPEPSPSPASERAVALRQSIARAMLVAKTTVPHFYLEVEFCLDRLNALKQTEAAHGRRYTLTTLLVAAIARALVRVPEANARWAADRVEIRSSRDVGVAVARPQGVIVPVLRGADRPVHEIGPRLERLITASRDGSVRQQDLGDASLTLSNLGMYGIDRFFPIINPPEAMIIGIGRARRVPFVVDDMLGIRTVVSCTASVDHRVIDGDVGGRFLSTLQDIVWNPDQLLA